MSVHNVHFRYKDEPMLLIADAEISRFREIGRFLFVQDVLQAVADLSQGVLVSDALGEQVVFELII